MIEKVCFLLSESLHQFTAPLLPKTIGSMDEKDISDDEATKEESASTVLRNRKGVRSKGIAISLSYSRLSSLDVKDISVSETTKDDLAGLFFPKCSQKV